MKFLSQILTVSLLGVFELSRATEREALSAARLTRYESGEVHQRLRSAKEVSRTTAPKEPHKTDITFKNRHSGLHATPPGSTIRHATLPSHALPHQCRAQMVSQR